MTKDKLVKILKKCNVYKSQREYIAQAILDSLVLDEGKIAKVIDEYLGDSYKAKYLAKVLASADLLKEE